MEVETIFYVSLQCMFKNLSIAPMQVEYVVSN